MKMRRGRRSEGDQGERMSKRMPKCHTDERMRENKEEREKVWERDTKVKVIREQGAEEGRDAQKRTNRWEKERDADRQGEMESDRECIKKDKKQIENVPKIDRRGEQNGRGHQRKEKMAHRPRISLKKKARIYNTPLYHFTWYLTVISTTCHGAWAEPFLRSLSSPYNVNLSHYTMTHLRYWHNMFVNFMTVSWDCHAYDSTVTSSVL